MLRIAEAVEPDLFVDEADLGEIIVRTIHRVERLERDRRRVVYRMEITGPVADKLGRQLGPQISADFPRAGSVRSRRRWRRSTSRMCSSCSWREPGG
jgi:hypothetical protein